MKRNYIKKYMIGLLACVLFLGNMLVMPVKAGSSNLVVDSSSFREELDTSLWNATDNRVTAENGTLSFSADSKKSTAIITKMIAQDTGYHDNLVSLDATMNLTNIPAERTFAVAMGLGSIEAVMGEPGNVEIQFTNSGGLKLSVVAYDLDGNKSEVVEARAVGSVSKVKVQATISVDAILTLSVNGSQVCNEKLPVSGEGRVGFLQSGACAAVINDLSIIAHRYDKPENCDIFEDFEKESINANLLTSKSVFVSGNYVPFGIGIKDINGNHVFEFKNVTSGYLGSMYQYSNFELTFDVVESKRVADFDDQGNMILPKNGAIVVSFGDEAEDYIGWGYETSTDAVVIDESSRVYSMSFGHSQDASQKGYAYASPDCDKPYTVRVSVIDGVVTTSMKWSDEEAFTEILQYKVSDINPLGFVHIWGVGAPTNFSIDNLTLVNKDIEPNLIEVDFKSALYNVPEDFQYEKIGYVYRDTVVEEGTGFSPYFLIPIVAVLCAVAFAVTVLITKKRTKKEVSTDAQE